MDFDALVNLKRIITSDIVTNTDIMLLKSAINNRNIDINISIAKNLDLLSTSDINNQEFMTYLGEFIDCDDAFLNTPIYILFLSRRCFYSLIYVSLSKGFMDEEVYIDIINRLFIKKTDLESLEEDSVFIKDMISKKGKISLDNKVNKDLLIEYALRNIDSLTSDADELYSAVNKSIILKLFSYGYINFTDIYYYSGNDSLMKIFIYSLLDMKDYSYFLSLLNEKGLSIEVIPYVESAISEYKENNETNEKMIEIILRRIKILENNVNKELNH